MAVLSIFADWLIIENWRSPVAAAQWKLAGPLRLSIKPFYSVTLDRKNISHSFLHILIYYSTFWNILVNGTFIIFLDLMIFSTGTSQWLCSQKLMESVPPPLLSLMYFMSYLIHFCNLAENEKKAFDIVNPVISPVNTFHKDSNWNESSAAADRRHQNYLLRVLFSRASVAHRRKWKPLKAILKVYRDAIYK